MARAVKSPDMESSVSGMADPILRSIMTLTEEELTAKVVVPLVERIHPGRVEYTHSSDEAGRDIVSFGRDLLGRPHILCVQIKAQPVSHGARAFGEVYNVSTSAKIQGVTRENGAKCLPNELWYVTSHPFPEWKRRQVSEILEDLDRKNIKFIPGDELSTLLREKLPELVSTLVAHSHPNLVAFVSALSTHYEGRAFGLTFDRQLDEFYVTAAVSSSTALGSAALRGEIELPDFVETVNIPLLQLIHLDELLKPKSLLRKLVGNRLPLHVKRLRVGDISVEVRYDSSSVLREVISTAVETCETVDFQRSTSDLTQDQQRKLFPEEVQEQLRQILFPVEYTHKLQNEFNTLVDHVRTLVADCPPVLTGNSRRVREAILAIRTLDDFVKHAKSMKAIPAEFFQVPTSSAREEIIRVKVPQPEHLLKLFDAFLIDGPPGCGKTTLLRILAVRLANLGLQVAYLSCADLRPESKSYSLVDLVNKFSRTPQISGKSHLQTVLALDGLDESPFDIAPKVEEARKDFASIVVACRSAYPTRLRSTLPQFALSPFNDKERGEFLRKWFRNSPELVKRAVDLIHDHEDLDLHTRLPLIATILVVLLENGAEPKTRADIYSMRLDLLLSRWDKARGVKRFIVDKPEAKRRFLRQLAFKMHSMSKRTRLIGLETLREIYEDSLGKWGYDQKFHEVLKDLVVSSGILIEESPEVFSFGHLTFQEHLAGEYLALACTPRKVVEKFGDDWWREALNFYACIKGDITEFADQLLDRRDFPGASRQLLEMLHYAPYTSPGLVEAFRSADFEESLD